MKGIFVDSLVSLIVRFPGFMESSLFKAVMRFFPAKMAPKYDRMIAGEPYYSIPIEEGVQATHDLYTAEGKYPDTMIDLCTGTGEALLKAREKFPDISSYAIDQSETMITLAKEKAEREGKSDTVFLSADASQLPFDDDFFDLALISNGPVFFAELQRILKPRGMALNTLSFVGRPIIKKRDEIKKTLEKFGFITERIEGTGNGAYIILRGANGGFNER